MKRNHRRITLWLVMLLIAALTFPMFSAVALADGDGEAAEVQQEPDRISSSC